MKTVSLLTIVGPREGDLRPPPARLRLKVLRWLLCIIVSAGVPDLAWAQYSSGGYSRPGGGSASGYSASSRRAPVSSSGGYSRRSYGGGGYATGSCGRPGHFPQHFVAGASRIIGRHSSRHSRMRADSPLMAPTMPGRAKRQRRPPVWEGSSQSAESRGRRCRVRDH